MVGVGAGLGLVMEGTSCGALLKELQVFNLLWKFALQFLPRYASLLLNVDVIFVFLDSLACLVNSSSLLFFGFYRFCWVKICISTYFSAIFGISQLLVG